MREHLHTHRCKCAMLLRGNLIHWAMDPKTPIKLEFCVTSAKLFGFSVTQLLRL